MKDILEFFAAGQTSEQILVDVPDLEPEDLKAGAVVMTKDRDFIRLLDETGHTTVARAMDHLRDGEAWVEIRPRLAVP